MLVPADSIVGSLSSSPAAAEIIGAFHVLPWFLPLSVDRHGLSLSHLAS